MSRIGKQELPLPAKVTAAIAGGKVTITGPKGSLTLALPPGISVAPAGQALLVTREGDDAARKALHGMVRSRLNNMIKGVQQPYEKAFEIQGKGWRCEARGASLALLVGFSHPVVFAPEPGIAFTVADQTHFKLAGIDNEQVGRVAATIRGVRPPEPYQGHGIRYLDEHVRRKVGKKSV